MPRPTGPIEEYPWPERLRAHAVTPGARPHLHGYDVEGDLARHYRFSDVTLLALLGQLPSDEQLEAFDVAMSFLSPLSVAEAPTHAAVLARICGAQSSGVLGAAAVALAERARHVVNASAGLLEWLRAPHGTPEARHLATTEEDRSAVERLRATLADRNVRVPALGQPLGREAALVATLHFAGLTEPHQLETAMVMASLPLAVAEARMHEVASFREYPIQLPPFEYEDP